MIKLIIRFGVSTLLAFSSSATLAADLIAGRPAPTMQNPAQALVMDGENIEYKDWLGSDLTGKVRVVHHLNAALGVDEINKPFIQTLNELNLAPSVFTTLTVLNVADVSAFLKQMAKLQWEDLRRTHANAEYVWDTEASVRSTWGLPEKGPSITLVDSAGNIIAHKDGKLTPKEIEEFVALIQQNLPK